MGRESEWERREREKGSEKGERNRERGVKNGREMFPKNGKGFQLWRNAKIFFRCHVPPNFMFLLFFDFEKKNVLRLSFFVSSFSRSQKYQFHVWSEIEMQHKSFGFLELLPKATSEWPLNCFKTQTLKSSHTQSCLMWQYSI